MIAHFGFKGSKFQAPDSNTQLTEIKNQPGWEGVWNFEFGFLEFGAWDLVLVCYLILAQGYLFKNFSIRSLT